MAKCYHGILLDRTWQESAPQNRDEDQEHCELDGTEQVRSLGMDCGSCRLVSLSSPEMNFCSMLFVSFIIVSCRVKPIEIHQ